MRVKFSFRILIITNKKVIITSNDIPYGGARESILTLFPQIYVGLPKLSYCHILINMCEQKSLFHKGFPFPFSKHALNESKLVTYILIAVRKGILTQYISNLISDTCLVLKDENKLL